MAAGSTLDLSVAADPGDAEAWSCTTLCLHRKLEDPMPDWPNERIKSFAGIYHKIGRVNPRCTGYIWWSNQSSVHFLSGRVHDESVLMDSEVKWKDLP